MKAIPILFAFIFFSYIAATAQPAAEEFVSGKGRLAIRVAGPPRERIDRDLMIDDYQLNGETVTWKDSNDFVELQYYYVYGSNTRPSEADKAKVISGYKKPWIEEFKKVGVSVTETPFTSNGFKGLELRAIGKGYFLARLFFTPTRLVFIAVSKHNVEGFDPLVAALDSFRFLPKDEWSRCLIAENMPQPLPQDANLKSWTSDAVQDGIKGPVKEVITDVEQTRTSSREHEGHEFFDEPGNLVRRISYHYGYPSDLTQFGWLDGRRASRENTIEYGSYEGPNEKSITELIMLGSPDAVQKKRDDRYSNIYEYKFDPSGRLLEWKTFQNTGEIWQTVVHSYGKDVHESRILDEKGKLNSRTLETLDASGNVVEDKQYDYNNKLTGTTSYKYVFDALGNWIVKRAYKGRKFDYAEYRTISYY